MELLKDKNSLVRKQSSITLKVLEEGNSVFTEKIKRATFETFNARWVAEMLHHNGGEGMLPGGMIGEEEGNLLNLSGMSGMSGGGDRGMNMNNIGMNNMYMGHENINMNIDEEEGIDGGGDGLSMGMGSEYGYRGGGGAGGY